MHLQLITYSALLWNGRDEDTLVLFKKAVSYPNKITVSSDNNFFRAIIFREVRLQTNVEDYYLVNLG